MLKIFKIIFFFLVVFQMSAQELNCTIVVNSDKIPGSNKQVFETLEKSINEYINKTKWTKKNYKKQEKIDCAMTIIIEEQENTNNFVASIQVQASRPVYNANYFTPTFNMKDTDFNFSYAEYDPLEYNTNTFDSNLISVLTFYVYTILGIDADTFTLNGGTEYFKEAENVMNQAQQSSYKGWKNNDGDDTRYRLIEGVLSPRFAEFRTLVYNYHRNGMDIMSEDKKKAKDVISDAINDLATIDKTQRKFFLTRVFMDAKSEELINVFTGGPNMNTTLVKKNLIRLSPSNLQKWNEIK